MTSIELNSHGQALYSLLLKPIIKTSPEWAAAYNDIKGTHHVSKSIFSSQAPYLIINDTFFWAITVDLTDLKQ